jgi:sulfide:quinone oxidoreductase
MRVAICGGGVAAVEALLGLRAFLGRAARVDLIAPNRCFVYEPLAVAEPFGLAQTRLLDLAAVAAECGAQLRVASLEAVEPDKGRIALSGGARLLYDSVIVAVGARRCAWLPGALHFSGAADVSSFRELLAQLERGELSRLAFVAPAGISWTLPTYELGAAFGVLGRGPASDRYRARDRHARARAAREFRADREHVARCATCSPIVAFACA